MAIGLARGLEGAAEGIERTQHRREQEKQRERTDTQFEQGQEDREYMLERREITDERADEQYRVQKKMQDRAIAGNEATRAFMTTGDLELVNEFLNMYSPAGLNHDVIKNEDGSYSATMEYKGNKETKAISEDDIGKAMQLYMTSDPYAKLEEQQSLERASAGKAADRAHDMAKIDREWNYRLQQEGIKQKGKDGKDGEGGLDRLRYDLSWQKELNDLAKEDYGSLFGEQWKFDTTQEKAMRSAQANLAGVYFRLMDEPDTNAASNEAMRKIRKLTVDAQNAADQELDEGQIEKNQYDNRVANIIQSFVDQEIHQLAPKPGEAMERTGEGETGQIPQSEIELLRSNPTDKMKSYFDEIYGPGSADKLLSDNQAAVDTDTGETEVVADFSLMREAQAGEVTGEEQAEKPKQQLSRKQRQERSKMSRKQHGQIALSEYQNEWTNMDDAEKLEWWQENSGALKARSKRLHKKASTDIMEIRKKTAKGRNL